MRALLERWAELEPAWCNVDDERASVMTDVGGPLERFRFEAQFHRLGQYEPHILAAVIEAIEARGWWWNVGTTMQPPVQAYVQSPERTFRPVRAETPAAALLGAYLAALEAEARPVTRYNTTHSPALEGCRDRVAALEAENARLREALTGLYQALRERHHGRMPDDVRVAYEQAAAALAGDRVREESARVLSEVAEANRRAVAEQEHGWRE